jgi:hypothetical protein
MEVRHTQGREQGIKKARGRLRRPSFASNTEGVSQV